MCIPQTLLPAKLKLLACNWCVFHELAAHHRARCHSSIVRCKGTTPTTHTLRHMNLTTPTAARLSALRHRPIEACASPHGLLGPNWLQSQGKPTGNCSCFTCIPSSYCQCLLRRSQFTGTSPAIPAARCSLNASSLTSLLSWDMYSSRVLRSVTSWLTTSSSDAQR